MVSLIQTRTAVPFPTEPENLAITALDGQHATPNKHRTAHKNEIISRSSRKTSESRQRERIDSAVNLRTLPTHQTTQYALLITPDRSYNLVSNFSVPSVLGPHEILIRNRAVGLNHMDWKSVGYNF